MIRAADVHQRVDWPVVLRALGVGEHYLRNKHGPCPACGGTDRFRFDDKGRGLFFCNGCGAGDGFQLLQRLHGWDFKTTLGKVTAVAGIAPDEIHHRETAAVTGRTPAPTPAITTARVRELLRRSCDPADVADVRDYLAHRHLWPLPEACALRGHAGADYFEDKKQVGRYAALVAPVRDIDNVLVTVHVTYLAGGRKVIDLEPRKILSPMTARIGCAVRLMPLTGDTLGIAEGIETCVAAAKLHDIPVWAALNTALLAKFEPPLQVRTLLIFADRDVAGLIAAGHLMQRLQGRVRFELRLPAAPAKDWADELEAQP